MRARAARPTRHRSRPVVAGSYLVFEGGEGSGKSTQARRLAARLDAVLTFEPGATALGSELRSLLLDADRPSIDARAETLLMAADRAQHLAEVVNPALQAGRHVVSDRSLYSSMAYQGGARGLGIESVLEINRWAVNGRLPDTVILLDLSPDHAVGRLRRSLDRLEREGAEFHHAVHASYRSMAESDPGRWIVIDASRSLDAIEDAIWAEVEGRLS